MTGMREQAKIHEVLESQAWKGHTFNLPQSIPPSKVTSSPDLIHEERDTSDMRGTAVIQQRGMNTGRCEELALLQSVTPALKKKRATKRKSVDWGVILPHSMPTVSSENASIQLYTFQCEILLQTQKRIKTGTFLGPLLTRNRNYSHVNLLWSTKPIYLFTYN